MLHLQPKHLAGSLLLFLASFCLCLQAQEKPHIVVLATGGTIAGANISSIRSPAFQAAVVPVDRMIAAVPEIQKIAHVTGEQIFQVPSENFTDERLIKLGKRVSELLKKSNVDGIVITHGVDTMEETAYFLNLTLKSTKPVVLVGAMRASTQLGSDGSANFHDAIAVAASKEAIGKGTLVSMNDEIYSARDVTMGNTLKLETLRSPYGPLGLIIEGKVMFYRQPTRPHTVASEFDIDKLSTLPRVDIVYNYGNVSPVAYEALVNAGAKAIIHNGTGNGSVAEQIIPVLQDIRSKGIHVVRASRTGNGVVIRDGEQPDDRFDWLVTGDQNAQKARILMALALTKTNDRQTLQEILWKY
ncbi:asparaginase [Herbaspirillum lusitanum]|uniref:asparaginase n=1 Tax=Herbaspirillum lusitanum TaxID=213312 RepID=UPI00223783A6|nr:asparaginase [Herbaspirillum lusitanum]MCW5298064.1 asparaginase [Herbaspirillum lusitanum]